MYLVYLNGHTPPPFTPKTHTPLPPAMCIFEAVARSFFHKSHFHHFSLYSKFSVTFHKLQHKIKNICLSSLPFLTGSHSHFKCQLLLFCVLWEPAAIMWLPFFCPPNLYSISMPLLLILSHLTCRILGFIFSLFSS